MNGMALRQLIRFGLAGGAGALAYFVFSSLLSRFGIAPWLASAAVYLLLIPCIYLVQKKFVFRSAVRHRTAFFRYIAIQILGLACAALLPYLLRHTLLAAEIAFIGVIACNTLLSFLLQKYWAFQ